MSEIDDFSDETRDKIKILNERFSEKLIETRRISLKQHFLNFTLKYSCFVDVDFGEKKTQNYFFGGNFLINKKIIYLHFFNSFFSVNFLHHFMV